jgi:predicted lactoylglutathione lyase
MEPRISLITLGVTDIDRSRRFYEALGWSGSSPDGEVVFISAGGLVLALWSRELLAVDSVVEDTGGWGGVTIAHNVRSAEQVDSVLAEAASAGATVARAGAPTEWGGYSGVFIDPDGHPWEVAHNPHWEMAEDGSIRLP